MKKTLKWIADFLNIDLLSEEKDQYFEVERIKEEFSQELPEELRVYIQYVAPLNDFYFDTVGNPMRLYSIQNLKKMQDGYNYNTVQQKPIEGWPENYFIIADEGGDPVVIDLESGTTKMKQLIHGSESWAYGTTIAGSIEQFLLCNSALHYTLNEFEEEVIIDDENGFCLAPKAAEWYFKNMKVWAGSYYEQWCTIFDNCYTP
ncbi:SMI1/KNR4 family protein [Tenacibaculum maritimum]|uniref:SMI1/KNR4 family protein n=1 Tax=Tenacibaculum maritimum TaxID=107401 RepID=UPI0038767959